MTLIRTAICIVVSSLVSSIAEPGAKPAIANDWRAGAAAIDITPLEFPVKVNGGMMSRTASQTSTPIYARALVIQEGDDGEPLAIVVADSCMMPRPLLDEAKQLAAQRCGIDPDRMTISATHTHTAPSAMGALGTDVDERYVPFLRNQLAEAIVTAAGNLEPAEIGFGATDAGQFTAVRRWIRRTDRMAEDPFGNLTVQANMHAASNWDDVTGPAGPEDPELAVIGVRSLEGRPIALLANFSMHYFSGETPISSDYFGRFCHSIEQRLQESEEDPFPKFVAMMSHGCSGDIWRRDYSIPAEARNESLGIQEYSNSLAELAISTFEELNFKRQGTIAMSEHRLAMSYRTPSKERLNWAQSVVDEMKQKGPSNQVEVYAREQLLLHELQMTEVVVQAIRIGDWGIATTPTETYALTGLKLKLQSPFEQTVVFDLANGGDGYIPPPEQHVLGGYNTWAARSAGLEVEAEPKIVASLLQQMEQLSDGRRKPASAAETKHSKIVKALRPVGYWRLDDLEGPTAVDSSGNDHIGVFEDRIVFGLEGVVDGEASEWKPSNVATNRAAHFAGGRLKCSLDLASESVTYSFWCWNGRPVDARGVTGWMLSHDHAFELSPTGFHLGIEGTNTQPGRLLLKVGADQTHTGQRILKRWQWHHVAVVRDAHRTTVYLDGAVDLEVKNSSEPLDFGKENQSIWWGGRSDQADAFEGRLDELTVFDRPLTVEEIQRLSRSAGKVVDLGRRDEE